MLLANRNLQDLLQGPADLFLRSKNINHKVICTDIHGPQSLNPTYVEIKQDKANN